MKQHQRNQIVSVLEGVATLENGQTVDLKSVQQVLNEGFAQTGEYRYAQAATALAVLTGLWQEAQGGFVAVEDVH